MLARFSAFLSLIHALLGLDFSLLEQQKAKIAAQIGVEVDEELEAAFLSGSHPGAATQERPSTVTIPKKRTRDEIVAELKRQKPRDVPVDAEKEDGLEKAKKMGRFKPIGAPAQSAPSKSKKTKGKKVPRQEGKVDVVASGAKSLEPSTSGLSIEATESSIQSVSIFSTPASANACPPEPPSKPFHPTPTFPPPPHHPPQPNS